MDVSEINDRDSFKAWLEDKPEEWAQVLAARCALRVAPFAWSVAALSEDFLEKKHRENLTLLTFRSNFISSVAGKYPTDDMKRAADAAASAASAAHAAYAADAADAAYAAYTADAAESARAAAYAAYAAYTADAAYAARAAAYAANAYASTDSAMASTSPVYVAASFFWDTLRADCSWLAVVAEGDDTDSAKQAQASSNQPLWMKLTALEALPMGLQQKIYQFKGSELAQTTSFGLITDWYASVLQGKPSPFSKEAELAIALMSKEDWGDGDKERDCVAVMDRVAKLAGWVRDVTRGGDFYLEDDEQEEPYYASRGAEKSYFNSEKIKHTLKENKNVVLSMCHSLLLQIAEYKEKIRGKNQIDEQTRNDLIAFLGNLEADLKDIVEAVVTDGMRINDDTVNRVKSRLNRFNYRFKENLPKYFEPEHLADITPPVSIILGCGSIGALFGGPVGFGIGAFVGKLVTQEAKPGQSSDKVREMFEQEDTNINS